MTVYADINLIADFDSTVGTIANTTFGGYANGRAGMKSLETAITRP